MHRRARRRTPIAPREVLRPPTTCRPRRWSTARGLRSSAARRTVIRLRRATSERSRSSSGAALPSRKQRLAEQRRHRNLCNVRIVGDRVEDRRDQLLEYPSEAARAGLVLEGQLGDLLEYLRVDRELDAFVLEDFPELAVDRVFRLDHDPHQHFPSEILKPFFFSSRRRHTRSTRDWSSDVCSSD